MLKFVLWCSLVTSGAFGLRSIPDEINKLIRFFKPALSKHVSKILPATIGNCTADNAPQPCHDIGHLHDERALFYHAKARWLSGINELEFQNMHIRPTHEQTRLTLSVQTLFKHVPMSLKMDLCVLIFCKTLWDSHDSCCGRKKQLWGKVSAECSPTFPYLTDPVVEMIGSDQLKVEVPFLGIKLRIADITDQATAIMQIQGQKFLTQDMIIQMNEMLHDLIGGQDLTCDSLLKT